MVKIVFDFDGLKDFIQSREDEHIGRCNERYYTKYNLLEDGRIQYQNYAYTMSINEDWKDCDIKGEIIEDPPTHYICDYCKETIPINDHIEHSIKCAPKEEIEGCNQFTYCNECMVYECDKNPFGGGIEK